MKLLDRIFPSWSLHREMARRQLEQLRHLSSPGYSGSVNNQSARSATSINPISETQIGRLDVLHRARQLDRVNAWAHGVFNSITNNVIGNGIKPESSSMFFSGEKIGQPDTELNKRVEDAFGKWAETVDLTGAESFWEIQREVYRELWVANDVLVVQHVIDSSDSGEVPLRLEVVPTERLVDSTETLENGNSLIQGIEFDESKKIVAYHLERSKPSDYVSGLADGDVERIPFDRVSHLFRKNRPGQVRGISRVASVAKSFDALALYLDHELTRAGIAAAFVWHRKSGSALQGLMTGDMSERTDDSSNDVINITGGMMLEGGPNDQIEGIGPAIQSTAFDPFVVMVLRSIASGLNISYELLARDFTKTNFSSARQSALEDRRHWEPEQRIMVRRFCDPVWKSFIKLARISGVLQSRKSYPVKWTPPGWAWVDPNKEAQATSAAIQMGLDSPQQAASRRGSDFFENIRERAAAETFASDHGINLSFGNKDERPEQEEKETPTTKIEDNKKNRRIEEEVEREVDNFSKFY